MTSENNAARKALEIALGEYLDACAAIRSLELGPGDQTRPCPDARTSGLLADEYLRLASLEKRVQQARSTIITSRNRSSSIVPINTLPLEILVRVFQLVVRSEPCKLNPWSEGYGKLPKYPIPLTHVCAHWRQIILHTPLFWSHIDIIPLLQSDRRLQSRAQTFLARAAHSLLDIHITTRYPTDEYWEATDLQKFLSPLIPRMRSLDLEVYTDDDEEFDSEPLARAFTSSILSTCFSKNCTPGTLTRISFQMGFTCEFIETYGNIDDAYSLEIDVPPHHFEDIWRQVTVLRLDGVFSFWTSSAYHGLIELSLDDWTGRLIPEHQLANILSSSPQLCVFTFGLSISPAHTPCKAVSLPHLEGLILYPRHATEMGDVLRLLRPGSKPLRLTIQAARDGPSDALITEAAKLFARSNINALQFVGAVNYFKLLGLVNKIENLAFTIASSNDINTLIRDKPANTCPERLYILNTNAVELEIDGLLQLVRAYAPKRLVLWGLYRINRVGVPMDNVTQIEEELSTADTMVKVRLWEPPKAQEYLFASY